MFRPQKRRKYGEETLASRRDKKNSGSITTFFDNAEERGTDRPASVIDASNNLGECLVLLTDSTGSYDEMVMEPTFIEVQTFYNALRHSQDPGVTIGLVDSESSILPKQECKLWELQFRRGCMDIERGGFLNVDEINWLEGTATVSVSNNILLLRIVIIITSSLSQYSYF